jgi:hypothetical protein
LERHKGRITIAHTCGCINTRRRIHGNERVKVSENRRKKISHGAWAQPRKRRKKEERRKRREVTWVKNVSLGAAL